ncbi:MAG: hypothetical protein KGY99_00850 [Phycisphaerae bacterium]|nr:hypothetical protein [Phycisphaerae bacterium]
MNVCTGIFAGVCVMVAASAPAADGADTDAAPGRIDLPHAGISLALPDGYTLEAAPEASVLLRGVPAAPSGAPVSVSLSAVLTNEETTAGACAERMYAELSENIDFRELERLKRLDARIAGSPGVMEVLSYVTSGEATVALRGLWLRDVPGGEKLCYVLSAETSEENRGALTAVFRSVLASLKVTEIRSPAALPVRPWDASVTDVAAGYRLAVPLGWYVAKRFDGTVLAQSDYRAGGAPGRRASVSVTVADAEQTPRAFLDFCQRRSKQLHSTEPETVSTTDAELGGRAAVQRVLLPAAGEASGAASSATPSIVVHRAAIVARGGQPRAYSLLVMVRTDDASVAERVAEQVAEGFAFLETAATQPDEDGGPRAED